MIAFVFQLFIRSLWSWVNILSTIAVHLECSSGIFQKANYVSMGFILKDAMGVAYLLDHTKSTSTYVGDDKINTIEALIKLAALLGYSQDKREKQQVELTKFLVDRLVWSDEDRSIYYKYSPSEWWMWDGPDTYPLRAPIAQRVFTIPTSSTASERSWSIFKYIYYFRRNRLSNDKVIKLAFNYSNQGSEDATGSNVYDTVVDSVGASTSEGALSSINDSQLTVSDELLRSICQLEQMTQGIDGERDEAWLDGAHWGDEDHFPGEASGGDVLMVVVV
ncbi:hypothetical protein JG687_00012539 [Phytophthora cactorum]|uniref:HAT C-terminal dimerisation domain-containing protein n=1 Tax=Phytophthora cactorum TaxID=29920 RepID=A0A329RUV5_9STRA|nr:hypothetical protein JG687_00012539 [Phytophthora cactorum]RAW27152.1 hypothetical protein PC110_g16455 [Phytophthora cactorum]